MTPVPRTVTRVLAVMDDSEGQVALKTAAALSERHGAALDIVACLETPRDLGLFARSSGQSKDAMVDSAANRVAEHARLRLSTTLPDCRTAPTVLVGKTYLEVIRHVAATDCDFVVKRADPPTGASRFQLASTDQHLLRKCPCPVWLQTPTAPVAPTRVLAAIDLDIEDATEPDTQSRLNRRVFEVARLIATGSGAQIDVLHAWDTLGEGMVWAFASGSDPRGAADRYVNGILASRRAAMARFLSDLGNGDGPGIEAHLVRGAPEVVIEQQSRRLSSDVVVMGTVARTGLRGVFIGNTAENIINSLGCPLVAVKPDGFVSPLLRD